MKRILLYLLAFVIIDAAMAGGLTARTSIELAKRQLKSGKTLQGGQPIIDNGEVLHAMVTVDDPAALSRLCCQGVTVNSQFGNIATVTLPLNVVPQLARAQGVKSVDIEKHYSLCNDIAREMSRFPAMTVTQDGYTRPAYTGNGVVVGMIDVGVDFNHINFLDDDGNCRIVRAYLPCDKTGSSPVVDGMQLPGSEYATPEQIRSLSTDDSTATHGTHTTGTAAGSYFANGYNGVATGAQIVVCAMPEDKVGS